MGEGVPPGLEVYTFHQVVLAAASRRAGRQAVPMFHEIQSLGAARGSCMDAWYEEWEAPAAAGCCLGASPMPLQLARATAAC